MCLSGQGSSTSVSQPEVGVDIAITSASSSSTTFLVRRGSVYLQMASRVALVDPMGMCTDLHCEVAIPRTWSICVNHNRKMRTGVVAANDTANELIGLLAVHLEQLHNSGSLDVLQLDSCAAPERVSGVSIYEGRPFGKHRTTSVIQRDYTDFFLVLHHSQDEMPIGASYFQKRARKKWAWKPSRSNYCPGANRLDLARKSRCRKL